MKCEKVVRRCKQRPEKHRCGLTKCCICGKFVQLEGHRCLSNQRRRRKKRVIKWKKKKKYPKTGTTCRILPYRISTRRICIVQNEAGDEWIFQGDNTRDEFCEWLFTTEHGNCRVMAHNFQGYDSYFVLQYLREHGVKYDVIMRGAKVLSLTVDMFNVRFVDSLNFTPMKLANFPKTFGIEELAKGYFPHLFNKKENESYVGPIPPAPYYNPTGMNPKDRETFLAWHTTKKESNYVFNFKKRS